MKTPTLVEVLDEEIRLYQELLALLKQEELALLAGSGQFTASSLAQKEGLILEIRLAEISRQAAVRRMTGRTDTRLSELPDANDGELGQARARLSTLLPEVEVAANRVDTLLARSLRRLNHTLDLIREAAGLGPCYTPGGALVQAAVPTLDGKA
jgi:flagellar biosynthesis/type III secretory pathway chaperone